MLGLSKGNTSSSYDDIDFALYPYFDQVRVYEGGIYKGSFGTYATGDILRVAVVGGVVRYSRNGAFFYSSAVAPTYPLLVDTALYSPERHAQQRRRGGTAVAAGTSEGGRARRIPRPERTAGRFRGASVYVRTNWSTGRLAKPLISRDSGPARRSRQAIPSADPRRLQGGSLL